MRRKFGRACRMLRLSLSAGRNALASGSTGSASARSSCLYSCPFWRLTASQLLRAVLLLCLSSPHSPQDVISRIQAMEAAGRLTGVLDDRGKFLSIEPAELDAVARWINRRGRVTIADLVTESNKLIDLNGEETQEQLVIDDEDDSKAA